MADSGFYVHPAGSPSTGGVLDVGLKCVHSCRFCYYSYQDSPGDQFRALRMAGQRSTEDCLAILDGLAAHGLKHVDVTGGEPTLHPGLPDMARHAASLGLAMRVITLGQMLERERDGKALLDHLLDAGLPDFLFSVHAVEEEPFRHFTKGAWSRLDRAMRRLDDMGVQYCGNTVVFQENLSMLPAIARRLADSGVYSHNFILFNAYHRWSEHPDIVAMQPRFTDVRGPLDEAVSILVENGVAVNVRYAPFCMVRGLERHVVGVAGVHYDPFEWRNRCCNYDREPAYCAEPLPMPVGGVARQYALHRFETPRDGLVAERGDGFKVFPEACAGCAAMEACDGLDKRYLEIAGSVEIAPYPEFPVRGVLAKARLDYSDPFHVKTAPHADMRAVMAQSRTATRG